MTIRSFLSHGAAHAVVPVLVLVALAGCPLAEDDSLSFGKACTEACADGFYCDKARSVCLPGSPPPAPVIDVFAANANDVRPDEDMTLDWESTDAVACVLEGAGEARDVEVDGSVTVQLGTAGDHALQLSCTGGAGDVVTSALDVHVRVVVESLALATQEDVDANVGVEEVDGEVTITAGVANTSALGLRIVHGDLKVFDLTSLGDLTLPALTQVDGDLIIRSNDTLGSVHLDELLRVGGQLLVAAQAFLNVSSSASLDTFSALRLEEVGGAVALSAYEYADDDADGFADDPVNGVVDNTLGSLSSVVLSALRTVGGSFRVESAPMVRLDLPSIESIGGALVFFGNDGLTGIDWPVQHLGAGAVFERNASLASVRFPALTTMGKTREPIGDAYQRAYAEILSCAFDLYEVGDLFFVGNDPDGSPCDFGDPFDSDVVETLELPALTTVEGRLLISGIGISSLSLPSLESAGGLVIHRNGVLTNVSLPALTTVGARGLELDGGDAVSGLGSLATIEGDLFLDAASLPTFTSLTTIGGGLDLAEVDQAELAKLPALASVGRLILNANAGTGTITSLELPALTTVETLDLAGTSLTGVELCGLTTVGTLRMVGTGVTTLDGLASLTEVTTLDLRNQTGLAQCLVDALAVQVTPATNTSANNSGTAPDPCEIGQGICG